MKIYVGALNGHRAGEFMCTAVRIALMELGHTVTYNVLSADAIIGYATLVNNYAAHSMIRYMKAKPSVLLHDDYAIPDQYDNIVTLSAYNDEPRHVDFINTMWYHPLYANPISNVTKEYDLVYGGTFKKSRLDSYIANIPNNSSTLLIGSDKEWDYYFPGTTRMNTIKDMYVLYSVMAKAQRTFVAYDEKCEGKMIPLRAIEPYMCGIDLVGSNYTGKLRKQDANEAIKYIIKELECQVQ